MRVWLTTIGTVIATTTLPALPAHAAPPGSYQQSCNGVRDDGRGQMTAQCRDVNGRYRSSSLDYSGCRGDIGNSNGQLICNGGRPGNGGGDRPGPGWGGNDRPGPGNGGGWNGPLPAGSWQRTCRGAGMRGPSVIAQCRSGSGRWFDTRIDMRSCRSGRLENRNGQLVCD